MSEYYVKCACCHKKYIYESSPMIRDDLWEKACGGNDKTDEWYQLMCRECIEKKLGRKLTEKDLDPYTSSVHDQEFLHKFL